MRKIFILLLFVVFASNFLQANDSIATDENAKIVIFRENIYVASAVNYTVLANGEPVILLRNNSYFEYICPPGNYEFSIKGQKESGPKFYAEAGETYYIGTIMRQGMWKTVPILLMADEISAIPIIERPDIRYIESAETKFRRPSNSIGLNMMVGFGLKNEAIYKLDKGNTSSFGYGSGFGIGLKYTRDFNDLLDLEVGIDYLSSGLRPTTKDAKMDFNRAKVSLTPHFIIPIRDGETTRLRLGAGADYYFWNKYKIVDPITPMNDVWTYKKSIGYHAEALFDMNVQPNFSFTYGLRWTGAKHSIDSFGKYISDDPFYIEPNANSISFIMGLNYHF